MSFREKLFSVANNSIDRFDRCICISREAFALDLVLSRAKWIPVFPDDGERMPFLSSSTAMPLLLGFIRTWGKIVFPIDDERKRIVRRMQRFFIFLKILIKLVLFFLIFRQRRWKFDRSFHAQFLISMRLSLFFLNLSHFIFAVHVASIIFQSHFRSQFRSLYKWHSAHNIQLNHNRSLNLTNVITN